jgi:superoxide dismutase, Fe-Mn family
MNRRAFLTVATSVIAASTLKAHAFNTAPVPKIAEFLGVYPHSLPPLSNANYLGEAVNARNVNLHHGDHHQKYVTGLNNALAKATTELQATPLPDLLANLEKIPEALRADVRFHGGGHLNHAMYWRSFAGARAPSGGLAEAIARFGGVEKVKAELIKIAGAFRGSGWVWLNRKGNDLEITTTINQDNPLMFAGLPLLGVDLWEHAYYPTHDNGRGKYVALLLERIDWSEVGQFWDIYSK